jgi:hypothetical protein
MDRLEDRKVPTSGFADAPIGDFPMIGPDAPLALSPDAFDLGIAPAPTVPGHLLSADDAELYRLELDRAGVLDVRVSAQGWDSRLALLGPGGRLLRHSDATGPNRPNDRITLHLTPGTYYLEVSALRGAGPFTLDAGFRETLSPSEPLPAGRGSEAVDAADFDGDGRMDLVVADTYGNELLVYEGIGNGSFAPPITVPVGVGPTGFVACDLDGDGRPDIVTANQFSDDLSIVLSLGSEGFAPAITVPTGRSPNQVVPGDLNGDGRVDLVVTNQIDGTLSIYLNRGGASLEERVAEFVGVGVLNLALGDLDGDGALDIATSNPVTGRVGLLLGRGDGSFRAGAALEAGDGVSMLVIEDLNRDGRLDIACANMNEGQVHVFLGRGGGAFQRGATLQADSVPLGLVAADFNQDGHLDLAACNYGSSDVVVFLGRGDGSFEREENAPATGMGVSWLVATDFDGDGRVDLATADYVSMSATVMLGNGDGTFRSIPRQPSPSSPAAVATGDFNGDGVIDLVVPNDRSAELTILSGRPDGTFRWPITLPLGGAAYDVAVADLDGDGDQDVVVAVYFANHVLVIPGHGDGTFGEPTVLDAGIWPCFLTIADLDDDGALDIATGNYSTADMSLFYGQGDGSFEPERRLDMLESPCRPVAADLNEDGILDLAVPGDSTTEVAVRLGLGGRAYADVTILDVGPGPWEINLADLDADGHLDMVVSLYTAEPGQIAVLPGRGDGTFGDPSLYDVGANPYPIEVADLNGDGVPDLAIGNDGSDDVSVLMGRGDGTFGPERRYEVAAGPYGMVVADLDRDGVLDLGVVGYRADAVSVLHGLGDGTFGGRLDLSVQHERRESAAADFDGDGWLDMVIVNPGAGSVTVRLGRGDGTFDMLAPIPVGDRPRDLVATDLNRDGRLDLVVANAVSNDVSVLLGRGDGTFRAAAQQPVGRGPGAIVAIDLNGDGRIDLAVTNLDSGDVSVLEGLGDGTFRPERRYAVGSEPIDLMPFDANYDGRLDLVTANRSSGDLSFLLGDGRFGFSERRMAAPGFAPTGLELVKFQNNLPPMLVAGDERVEGGWFLYGTADTGFLVPMPVGIRPNDHTEGDFNGDGQSDVAALRTDLNLLIIVMVHSDYTYEVMPPMPLSPIIDGVVTGDFDADGRVDLALTSTKSDVIEIRLGVGDGTFLSPEATFSSKRTGLWVLDAEQDGVVDICVLDRLGQITIRRGQAAPAGGFDAPMLVNGSIKDSVRDATVMPSSRTNRAVGLYSRLSSLLITEFTPRTGFRIEYVPIPAHFMPSRVVSGDIDHDGLDDLVVLARGTNQAIVMFGAGGMKMNPEWTLLDVGIGPSDAVLKDLDLDGRLDLVVVNEFSGDLSVILSQPGRTFGAETRLAAGVGLVGARDSFGTPYLHSVDEPVTLTTGMFNSDPWPDLAVVARGSSRVALLYGRPGGTFTNPCLSRTYQTGEDPSTVVAARFRGGALDDLAILNRRSRTVTILLNNGRGGFTPGQVLDAGSNPTDLIAADVNGDGIVGILISSANGDLLEMVGKGDGTFAPYQRTDRSVRLAAGDLDGDGVPEVVVSDQARDQVRVDFGERAAVERGREAGMLAPGAVRVEDLDGDGTQDLIVLNSGSNDAFVFLGTGSGLSDTPRRYFTGTDPEGLTIADVDGNGLLDLIVANAGSNDVTVLLGIQGPGGWDLVAGPRLRVGWGPTSTTVEDVDGDGLPDLVVVNTGGNTVSLLRGLGGGFFDDQQARTFRAGVGPIRAYVGHFEGLEGLDLVILNSQSSDLYLYDDFFEPAEHMHRITTGGLTPIAAVQGDYDHDGYDDLMIAHRGDARLNLLAGGEDGLSLARSLSLGGGTRLTDLIPSDAPDGQTQFLISTEGRGGVIAVPVNAMVPSMVIDPIVPPQGATPPATTPITGLGNTATVMLAMTRSESFEHMVDSLVGTVSAALGGLGAGLAGAVSGPSASSSASVAASNQGLSFVGVGLMSAPPAILAAVAPMTMIIGDLTQMGQSQISDILPLNGSQGATVAVLLTTSDDVEEGDAGLAPSQEAPDREPAPEEPPALDRFMTGIESSIDAVARSLFEAEAGAKVEVGESDHAKDEPEGQPIAPEDGTPTVSPAAASMAVAWAALGLTRLWGRARLERSMGRGRQRRRLRQAQRRPVDAAPVV